MTTLLVLVATLTLFAYQQGIIGKPASSPALVLSANAAFRVAGTPALGKAGTLDLGVTTDPLARNWWKPWQNPLVHRNSSYRSPVSRREGQRYSMQVPPLLAGAGRSAPHGMCIRLAPNHLPRKKHAAPMMAPAARERAGIRCSS